MEDRCPNYELCGNNKVPETGSPFCMTCGSWFKFGKGWDRLEFIDDDEECSVCMNNGRKIMFPANCGHSFCINCFRNILLGDETRHHISPVPYGAPRCPDHENPVKGRQCYCENYDVILEEWRNSDPIAWEIWNEAEHESIDTPDPHYNNSICPLCRAKYTRN